MKLEYADYKVLVEVVEEALQQDVRELKNVKDFYNRYIVVLGPDQAGDYNKYFEKKELRIKTLERLLSKATEHIEI